MMNRVESYLPGHLSLFGPHFQQTTMATWGFLFVIYLPTSSKEIQGSLLDILVIRKHFKMPPAQCSIQLFLHLKNVPVN